MKAKKQTGGLHWTLLCALTAVGGAQAAPVGLPDPPMISGAALNNVTIRATNTQPFKLLFGNPADPSLESVTVEGLYLYQTAPCPGCERADLLPARLAVSRGQRVSVRLDNALAAVPAGETTDVNLHVHGGIVPPNVPPDPCGVRGDDVFVVSHANGGQANCRSHGNHVMGADSMQMVEGSLRYEYRFPTSHPSGLNWYHPHVHGSAEAQVGGGMSGLMTVGDLWDDIYINCALPDTRVAATQPSARCGSTSAVGAERSARTRVRERFVLLKDVQIARQSNGTYGRVSPFDKQLCTGGANRLGYCADGSANRRWVFSVNGVAYPTVSVAQSQSEIWRIANASADVTYRLQWVVTQGSSSLPVGTVLPVRVLSQDGATLNSSIGSAMASISTLMPGARTEVLLDPCAMGIGERSGARGCYVGQEVVAELRTLGVDTGASPGAGAGDQWPALAMAQVRFLPSAQPRDIVPLRSIAPAGDPSGGAVPVPAPEAAPMPSNGAVSALHTPVAPLLRLPCTPDPLAHDQARVIRFNNGAVPGGEFFGIRAEKSRLVLPRDPSRIDLPDLTPQPDLQTGYSRVEDANSQSRLCIRHGRVERWVVINDSQECHNFHIHQMRFKVRRIQPGNTPADAQCLGDRVASLANDAWHDNFPVPPGARVLIDMPFNRPEQLGRFVYHCHILEHEDKGMMAVVEVVR